MVESSYPYSYYFISLGSGHEYLNFCRRDYLKAHFIFEIIMYFHLMQTAVNQSFGSFLIMKANFHNLGKLSS